MTDQRDAMPVKSDHAVFRIIDGEAVIVHLRSGQVNVTNTVGSRIWEMVDGKRDVSAIAGIIADEYDVTEERALTDTREFIIEMSEKGLICCR